MSELERLLGERWQRRAQAELETGIFFAQLAPRVLREVRELPVLQRISAAVSEELTHAELCRGLAVHYLGREVDWPTPRSWPEPAIEGVSPSMETALLITSMCCINETLASAYLRACHQAATVPMVKSALQTLLGDEVHHAQAGWAFLAPRVASSQFRADLTRFLPLLLDFNLSMWLERIADEVNQPDHGYLDARRLEPELRACVSDVIVAGFHHLGVTL